MLVGLFDKSLSILVAYVGWARNLYLLPMLVGLATYISWGSKYPINGITVLWLQMKHNALVR